MAGVAAGSSDQHAHTNTPPSVRQHQHSNRAHNQHSTTRTHKAQEPPPINTDIQ
eukprot:CAMPEP_0171723462 /NCGR_PEP_ID=MMETSP0991-20121206/23690_1 /TAXON_ID=483369 /ORGANISM="non described non described, Strain CCMP2098" /LENGTH=53 /DNA_ID=CAMNT_0012315969 /DNA_START=52 /DNA_END=210 /DNA_ORIENTATION=+